MKRTIVIILLIFNAFSLFSQDVILKAEYPELVEEGHQFTISLIINSGGGELVAPPFEGFSRLMGPQTSYSSSTSIINGKMTRQTSYTYVYYLQAGKPGKYVLAPATFTIKNKTYNSDSIRIEVVGTNTARPSGRQDANAGGKQSGNETAGRGDIFVDLSINKREVYIGEHIVATVKLFTRVDLSGINEIKYPPFTGFLKSDLETAPLTSLKKENINGTIYGTGVIQQFILYPQMTGQINIDPVQITVLVQQRTGQADPFWGDFFSAYQTIPRSVASKALTVNIKPLPGVKPADFSGIVGKIDIKAALSKDTVNVNDAINFKITVSGNGNLKLAEAPALKLPPDIEVYDPKITDNIKNSASGTSGQKTFEYVLIPRHNGDFNILPVTYSYFNTSSGRYETLRTGEFGFHVRKGADQASGITVFGGVSKEDIKYMGKDIRFIKNRPGKLLRSGTLILQKRSFYSAYAISLFLFLAVLFIRREHVKRNADIRAVRNRKAGRVAVKRLKEASGCMKRGETDRFHEEILKSLYGYLSDKLNIPAADLTRNYAIILLAEKGIDEVQIKNLSGILDTCEYARYAPSAAGTDLSVIYEDASRFIRSVENSI